MADPRTKSQGTQPPPPGGHPLPRRANPDKSITLRHHRLARDASMRAGNQPAGAADVQQSPPRRTSSGESHHTGRSDPKRWFDHSNQNPFAAFGGNEMDVDPPFFQRESDSSNEGGAKVPYQYDPSLDPRTVLKPRMARHHSSSADEYRSVIDDLTVEIQRLKEELKRYKQGGPDVMRRDKLFEVKMHGLPKRKKRELEAKLREFAASVDSTSGSNATSSQRKKSSRGNVYSASGSMSKHALSSTGSQSRPVDSAYASMSTGHNSSGTSLSRPSMSSRGRTADQKVESYLKDIPEGLYPRHMTMTDTEKKKLVVRRLEQLFTGKIGGRHSRNNQSGGRMGPIVTEAQQPSSTGPLPRPPPPPTTLQPASQTEPSREARIAPLDVPKKVRYKDAGSASNSYGDQTESGGNGYGTGQHGNGSGNGNGNGSRSADSGGTNVSPPGGPSPPEQRPTRPKDLDPDRVQIPSENMEYIRHLGLVPPELLPQSKSTQAISPDEEGWVYLNLLANLAQLHMINVAPDFVRSAVSEKSTKLQLSADGRKIRWRGGIEGTKFSSDSSGDNGQRCQSSDDSDGSNNDGQRKRSKKKHSSADASASSSNQQAKFGSRAMGQSDYATYHYEPLFVRRESSNEQTSLDDTWSSFGRGEGSNLSGWGQSKSGSGQRKKRRYDGAIIYYSGAPFCTDLSGDPGDTSPTSYLDSSRRESSLLAQANALPFRPPTSRSESGSLLPFRPLSRGIPTSFEKLKMVGPDDDNSDERSADMMDMNLPWSTEAPDDTDEEPVRVNALEASGLGGVVPEDHFVVEVQTRRPKGDCTPRHGDLDKTDGITDAIASRLATMTTSSPGPAGVPATSAVSASDRTSEAPVQLYYLSGRIKRLKPMPLPAPAIFIPPFSTDESDESVQPLFESEDDIMLSSELTSRRANQHQSGVSSDSERGEEEIASTAEVDDDVSMRVDNSEARSRGDVAESSQRRPSGPDMPPGQGSSVATAGGQESGYSSSDEEED